MKKKNEILEIIQSCIDCMTCMDVCDTFTVTTDEKKSPNGRLKIAEKIFTGEEIEDDEIIGIYTCTLCGSCNLVCTQDIPISEMIHESKKKLVEKGKAPLENHKKIISDIQERDNSVGGKPEERLDWLPVKFRESEIYEKSESNTLLYLGCMSSFRVKESASASYELLKKGGFDFKIIEKEPCCGEYVYSAGDEKLAKKMFEENFNLFKEIGVKNLIVTCGGCLYAFNKVYPKYIKDFDIQVKHIVQVVHELVKDGKIELKPLNKEITYHDSCRMGRKLRGVKIYDEPRTLLKETLSIVKEFSKNKEDTPCCGAGSGIRGVDSSISIKIGTNIFEEMQTKELITSCPLCVFNFRYVNFKIQSDKECKYITDYLLDAVEK